MTKATNSHQAQTPKQREIIMGLYREVLEQIATGGPRTARKRLARALLSFVDYTLEEARKRK